MMNNSPHRVRQNGGCGAITIESPFDPGAIAITDCQAPNSLTAGEDGTITLTIQNPNDADANGVVEVSANGGSWGQAEVNVPSGGTTVELGVVPPETLAGQTVTPEATIRGVSEGTVDVDPPTSPDDQPDGSDPDFSFPDDGGFGFSTAGRR